MWPSWWCLCPPVWLTRWSARRHLSKQSHRLCLWESRWRRRRLPTRRRMLRHTHTHTHVRRHLREQQASRSERAHRSPFVRCACRGRWLPWSEDRGVGTHQRRHASGIFPFSNWYAAQARSVNPCIAEAAQCPLSWSDGEGRGSVRSDSCTTRWSFRVTWRSTPEPALARCAAVAGDLEVQLTSSVAEPACSALRSLRLARATRSSS